MKTGVGLREGLCGALLVACLGCGTTVEAGLANAQSANRSSQPRRQHDVITNGRDACGEKESSEYDPACEQRDTPDASIASAPAVSPATP
jgi:hypothetical protein